MVDSEKQRLGRRTFLTAAATAAVASAASVTPALPAQSFKQSSLRVWACGGLSEAFLSANRRYQEKYGIEIVFTGAFAAALGKSLMGNGETDVFANRVLALAQKLRQAGKMESFQPLCFTRYVLVTPKGNPAGVTGIADLARDDVRVILAPDASPPGGEAVQGLLKKAGVLESVARHTVIKGSCVQRTLEDLIAGKGDASVVEARLTCLPAFRGKVEVLPISEEFFPPGPLTFTIGVMRNAPDKELARHFVDFILSEEGQAFFAASGFIPAQSADGARLVEKLGVKDVG